MKLETLIISILRAIFLSFAGLVFAENIDSNEDGSQYAYGENVGWLNFKPNQGPGITVSDDRLTGYVWAENTGWIYFRSIYMVDLDLFANFAIRRLMLGD